MRSKLHHSLLLIAAAASTLLLSACATGGGGSSRGSVSEVAARAAPDDNAARETGRTRTKTDHRHPSPEDDGSEYYDDNDYIEDEVSSFLADLLINLFTSGGDDDGADDDRVRASDSSELPFEPSRYSEFAQAEDDAEYRDHNDTKPAPSPVIDHDNLIVWLSWANLAGDAVKGMSTVSVMYSGYTGPRFRGHAGLFYGDGSRGPQSLVQNGINKIWEYGADIGARKYLTDRHSLVDLYVLFGLRFGALRWTYQQSVVFADETSVASDGVLVFIPYVGLGGTIMQVKPLQIGASLSWGPRITFTETLENFDNDLFRNVGEMRLNLEASVFF